MKKTYALFDFDGTLIRGDSTLLFLRYAWRKKLCSVVDLFRFAVAGGCYVFRVLSSKRAKELGLRFIKGRGQAAYADAVKDFCDTVLMPRLYPQAAETLQKHQAAGDEIILISASFSFYLKPLKQALGLTEVLATDLEIDAEGRFTGRIAGQNCHGEEKPRRLQAYLNKTGAQLDFESSCAYGDSRHDLPMFALCKNAYAINPGIKLRNKLKTVSGVTAVHWKDRP